MDAAVGMIEQVFAIIGIAATFIAAGISIEAVKAIVNAGIKRWMFCHSNCFFSGESPKRDSLFLWPHYIK